MDVAANETNEAKQNTSHNALDDAPCVVYRSHPETGPASELQTLANIYAFILESYQQKQLAAESAADPNTTEVEQGNKPGGDDPRGEGSF